MAENLNARIAIRVHARARNTGIIGKLGDVYKLNVSAPALQGKVNEAFMAYITKVLGVHHSRVKIIIGLTSPSRVIEVEGVSREEIEKLLTLCYESH